MGLSFNNISFAYDKTQVLTDLDLDAKTGEITCLLGSSGCGKSTLLRLAAGLELVQQGSITLTDGDSELLASSTYHLAPEQRPIGMMFQENALFPNMNVRDNIAFGLDDLPKQEQLATVNTLLSLTGLEAYGERRPHQLSGGQQQRIALARAIAPKPKVLLMDEPFASIDVTLRRQLRETFRQTLKQSNSTAILVTHDPLEAMEMADRIAFMQEGKVLQCDSPQALYHNPAAASVAVLFDDAQQINSDYEDGEFKTAFGVIKVDASKTNFTPGSFTLVARPEGLSLKVHPPEQAGFAEAAEVLDVRFSGNFWNVYIARKNERTSRMSNPEATAASQASSSSAPIDVLRVATKDPTPFAPGTRVMLSTSLEGFHAFANTQK